MTNFVLRAFSILALLLIGACARGPIKNPEQAMRPTSAMPSLNDDLEFASLVAALDADIKKLREAPDGSMSFGPVRIANADYAKALEFLLIEAKLDPSGTRFFRAIRENFEPFEIYGRSKWGEVFMTSYYEPILEGARKPTGRFRQPLYGVPKDLIDVDLGSFIHARPSLTFLKDIATEQRSQSRLLRGRLTAPKKGENQRVIAYPSRAEITGTDTIKGQATELAWVDPIDAFFLEIQGSGVVRFDDGVEFPVGYAAQNGHQYVAIGKHLLGSIPKDKMSIQTIENHLRSVPENEARRIMNLNPSFVFFQPLKNRGLSFFGTEVVDGRTIATDQLYFPKGALAFLEYEKPVFSAPTDLEPASWQKSSRFVLDQDTGGAIRGPDRLDLYWGRGASAKQSAGVMKNLGRLIYFVPKKDWLQKL